MHSRRSARRRPRRRSAATSGSRAYAPRSRHHPHGSPRRETQRLIAAAAALDGRSSASDADLWPIVYAVPTADAQAQAREVLRPLLASSASSTLGAAAAEASLSPAARAARLVETAQALLSTKSDGESAVWRLKLEGVAREIDAGFAADARPSALADARAAIVAALPTCTSRHRDSYAHSGSVDASSDPAACARRGCHRRRRKGPRPSTAPAR